MSTSSEPLTSVSINTHRDHVVTDTVRLRFDNGLEDLCLSDLRSLVEAATHIPGDAVVQLRTDGIDIEYVERPDEPEESRRTDLTRPSLDRQQPVYSVTNMGAEPVAYIEGTNPEPFAPESYTIVDPEAAHELAVAVQEQQRRDAAGIPAGGEL